MFIGGSAQRIGVCVEGGVVVTCVHPLGHSFVHVCTCAGLGTREHDSFLQQALSEQLNCVKHGGAEDVMRLIF